MEDAATAEICRSQVWQWLKHGARLSDGLPITQEMVRNIISEHKNRLKGARASEAADIFQRMMTNDDFAEFLTQEVYDYID